MRAQILTLSLLCALGCEAETPEIGTAVPSLSGTDADCEGLELDATGQLAPTEGLRFCIDYFLTGLGEAPEPELRARLFDEVERRHPGQLARAADLYDRYARYLKAARAIAESGAGTLEDRRAAVVAQRAPILGPEMADGFYGLERRVRAPDLVLSSQQAVAVMRSLHQSEAEVDALRRTTFGPEAAIRLRALDARRADFAARYADYQRAAAGLDAPAAERLLEARFSEPERIRVRAWTRLGR